MEKRVVITGMGVVSPVGIGVKNFWGAVVEGKSGAGPITYFPCDGFSSKIAAEVKDFNPEPYISPKEVKHLDRFVQYSLVAAHEAMVDSLLDLEKEDLNRIGVLVGSGIGGIAQIEKEHSVLLEKGPKRISPFLIPMLIINMASGKIAMTYGLKGPNSAVSTACATGAHAIGDATKIIQRGEADVMVCGGTEAAITPIGFGGFCAMKALSTRNQEPEKASRPFDRQRDGFVMGEGAGILVLESLEHAQKRNCSIYGEVIGYGMSADAYHITAPSPHGEGAERAMRSALKDAHLATEDVDYINAHGTSTPLNDKYETEAIHQLFGAHAFKLAVSSTKSMIGHLLGAAGAVEAIASILTINTGIIHPTINYEEPDPECDLDYTPNVAREKAVRVVLSNSLGFGGTNATIILKKYE